MLQMLLHNRALLLSSVKHCFQNLIAVRRLHLCYLWANLTFCIFLLFVMRVIQLNILTYY